MTRERIHLRRAGATDAGAIADMVGEYWLLEGIDGFEHQGVSATLRGFLDSAHLGACWLAIDGDMPVGYLLGVLVFSLEHGGTTLEIDELFVRESHRRHGIGALLLEQAEGHFASLGCRNVSLQLGRGNCGGANFYARRGYRPRAGYALLEKEL